MKLAVSATGGSLAAQVAPQFGRAPYFVLVDTDRAGFSAVSNDNLDAVSGVGPQTASMLARAGVTVILTGRIGPKARQALDAAGITCVEAVEGTVQSAIDAWRSRQPR